MKPKVKILFALFVLTLTMVIAPINADTDAELKGRITASNNKVLNDARQDLMKNRELNNYDKDDIDGIMEQNEYLVNYSTNLFWQYYNANSNLYSTSAMNDIITPDLSGCAMSWPVVETESFNINEEETIQSPDQSIVTDIQVAGPQTARKSPLWWIGLSCAVKAAQAEQACLKTCMAGRCITDPNVWECQTKCSQEGVMVFMACIGFRDSTTTVPS